MEPITYQDSQYISHPIPAEPDPIPQNYELECARFTNQDRVAISAYDLCFEDTSLPATAEQAPDCYKSIEGDLVFLITDRDLLKNSIPNTYAETILDSPNMRGKLFVDFTETQNERELFTAIMRSYEDEHFTMSIRHQTCFLINVEEEPENTIDLAHTTIAGANMYVTMTD